MAEFRTRRPSQIRETSRCRAVFERSSYVTRWRRTGWLGRQDSNLRIRNRAGLAYCFVRRKEWQQVIPESQQGGHDLLLRKARQQ